MVKNNAGTTKPGHLGTNQPATPYWGVDVAGRKETFACYLSDDGYKFPAFPSFEECIKAAASDGVKTIKTERSFANYYPGERGELIDLAKDLGIVIMTMNTRRTPAGRDKYAFEKTDKNDAYVIYHMPWMHFKVASAVDPSWKEFSAAENYKAMWMRCTGLAEEIVNRIYLLFRSDLTEEQKVNLVRACGKTPRVPLWAAIIHATLVTKDRNEFERLIGLYDNGHACLFRSNVYNWGYGKKGGERTDLTSFRRSIRQLRSMIVQRKDEVISLAPEILAA
jgi:hypothetical protein